MVYGIIRRTSSINTIRIDHIYNNPLLKLYYGDLIISARCSIVQESFALLHSTPVAPLTQNDSRWSLLLWPTAFRGMLLWSAACCGGCSFGTTVVGGCSFETAFGGDCSFAPLLLSIGISVSPKKSTMNTFYDFAGSICEGGI